MRMLFSYLPEWASSCSVMVSTVKLFSPQIDNRMIFLLTLWKSPVSQRSDQP